VTFKHSATHRALIDKRCFAPLTCPQRLLPHPKRIPAGSYHGERAQLAFPVTIATIAWGRGCCYARWQRSANTLAIGRRSSSLRLRKRALQADDESINRDANMLPLLCDLKREAVQLVVP
jgi:hypothetical protein